jgi:hypothetical protein
LSCGGKHADSGGGGGGTGAGIATNDSRTTTNNETASIQYSSQPLLLDTIYN